MPATTSVQRPTPPTASSLPTNGHDQPPKESWWAGREFAAYGLATLFVLFEAVVASLVIYLVLLAFTHPPLDVELAGYRLTLFQVMPVILVLSWLGLMTGYFGWCTYFYNFNFGRSSRFWKHFSEQARQARQEGRRETDLYDEMYAPRKNPYAGQTFGMPPGTVRGTLALTIVVGGLALLISFFGGDAFFEAGDSAIVRDYFEFFKTAFLMVVAFYFGTKGLDIIERERTRRAAAQASRSPSPPPAAAPPASSSLLELDAAGDGAPTAPPAPPAEETDDDVPAAPVVTKAVRAVRDELLEKHYPQVTDHELKERARRELEPQDLEQAADEIELELALVQAVTEVESRGKGFLPSGRPKILFEGHIFWKQLEKYEIDPAPHAAAHPTIVYPRWTKKHYRGGEAEHDRLDVAKSIHVPAALCSASWGMFQIMGFNHAACGFDHVQDFVAAHETSEKEHLRAFLQFLRHTTDGDGRTLVELLRAHEWAAFASLYNGPGYRQNEYDVKLEQAFRRFSA